jgi:hypothetical protein
VDAQKRQKVILAVVAVLALGAGSYWYLGRDTGGNKAAAITEGPVTRKAKVVSEEPTKRKKEARAVVRDEPVTVERKEREAPEETTVERKKKREDKTKEKKKTITPAA